MAVSEGLGVDESKKVAQTLAQGGLRHERGLTASLI